MGDRRPLASRDTGWAKWGARRLAAAGVAPNGISVAGIIAAAAAGGLFWASAGAGGVSRGALLALAALFVQVRLLCNLLDGMVAIEGGLGTADGGFWNEAPDRASDMLILVGAALGAGDAALGWAAAAFAFLTAYVRELGAGLGCGADFCGPMAKPQRMALVTLGAIAAILEPAWGEPGPVLRLTLWLVAVGAAFTALRRSVRLVTRLRSGARNGGPPRC